MNHQEIRTNDRHIGGEQTCPRLLLFIHVLSLIVEWFRGDWIVSRLAFTSICRKPSTVPTAVTLPLHDDSVYFRTRPREMYVPAKLLSRHRTRARSRCRFRVEKYLPSYSLLTIISRYRMCKIYCLLIDPDLTRFLSLSLLLFVRNKRRISFGKLKYNSVIKVKERRREYFFFNSFQMDMRTKF